MQKTAPQTSPIETANFAHPHRNVDAFGIEEGMHIADFGAGSGAYVLAMAKALRGSGHVYAVDVQRDLLRRIQSEAHNHRLHNISVLWGDLERYGGSKIAHRKLDMVLISNLLFQVEDKEAVLSEAARVLKPTGRLIVIDWSEAPAHSRIGPNKHHVVPKKKLVELAHESSFLLEEEFLAGAHHYALVFSVRKV